MSTFRNPVGPQPPSVYWRRRIMVGLGVLAVIVIIAMIIFSPRGQADENKSPTDEPKTTETAAAPEQEEGAQCEPSVIKVEPVTDKDTYGAGQLPQVGFTITNTSSVACMMPVGADVQEFVITSGAEQYWTSKDCQAPADPATTVLKPNTPLSSQLIPWDRTRSSAATCEGERPGVPAGGASYHLKVTVGGVTSEGTKQIILN